MLKKNFNFSLFYKFFLAGLLGVSPVQATEKNGVGISQEDIALQFNRPSTDRQDISRSLGQSSRRGALPKRDEDDARSVRSGVTNRTNATFVKKDLLNGIELDSFLEKTHGWKPQTEGQLVLASKYLTLMDRMIFPYKVYSQMLSTAQSDKSQKGDQSDDKETTVAKIFKSFKWVHETFVALGMEANGKLGEAPDEKINKFCKYLLESLKKLGRKPDETLEQFQERLDQATRPQEGEATLGEYLDRLNRLTRNLGKEPEEPIEAFYNRLIGLLVPFGIEEGETLVSFFARVENVAPKNESEGTDQDSAPPASHSEQLEGFKTNPHMEAILRNLGKTPDVSHAEFFLGLTMKFKDLESKVTLLEAGFNPAIAALEAENRMYQQNHERLLQETAALREQLSSRKKGFLGLW